jgi:hypothetical protein
MRFQFGSSLLALGAVAVLSVIGCATGDDTDETAETESVSSPLATSDGKDAADFDAADPGGTVDPSPGGDDGIERIKGGGSGGSTRECEMTCGEKWFACSIHGGSNCDKEREDCVKACRATSTVQ